MGQPGSQAGFRLFSKKAFLQQAANVGYTNWPTRSTIFTVTNSGSIPVERAGWYWLESRSNPGQSLTATYPSLPSGAILNPGQSEFLCIPVPAIKDEWRLTLTWAKFGWQQKLNRVLSLPTGVVKGGVTILPTYREAHSDWLSK